ncbi:MAG TPA: hypothetical protein VHI52_12535, partial [Verrucomicrobiae bacterium]|nr:hypothetical protein [Verrucomicrobiae bacterium]
SNETARVRWVVPVTAAAQYNIAAQVPALTNACTNITFRLLAGTSNVCTVLLAGGFRSNQWNFICSAPLAPEVTNVLEMAVSGTNQPGTWAVADVVSVVPVVPSLLPGEERLAITPVSPGIRVEFRGEPGTTCTVERSSTPSGPWLPLDTLHLPLTGILEYQDRQPLPGAAFYRIINDSQNL